MLLSVVIVSYNTANLTRRCIETVLSAIEHSPQLDASSAEIIVIDNASDDDTLDQLEKLPVKSIANKINQGFAAANNQGIAQAQGKLVMLLNPDTEVDKPALDNLVTTFNHHPFDETTAHLQSAGDKLDRIGIVAASLRNPNGTYQPQGGSVPNLATLAIQMLLLDDLPVLGRWLPSTQQTGRGWGSLPPATQLEKKGWVGATAMVIHRRVFDEIGDLDANIFMYGEDIEFCLRARHHHWDIAIDHTAHVTHWGSASAGGQRAVVGELTSYRYIWAKHQPLWQLPLAAALLKMGCLIRIALFGILGKHQAGWYRRALAQL